MLDNTNLPAAAKYVSEHCLCFKTRQEARNVTRAYDQVLRAVGLRITQFTMLSSIVGTAGKLNITELAKLVGMDRTTYSRNLGPLVRRKIAVYTEDHPGRDRSVVMTKIGLDLYREAIPLWQQAQEKFGAGADITDV